jgi:hypothetical protein
VIASFEISAASARSVLSLISERGRAGSIDIPAMPVASSRKNPRREIAGSALPEFCRFVVSGSTIGLLSDLPSLSNRQLPSFASGALAM